MRGRSYPIYFPRHACSPRDRSRAGDLWRLTQEVAVADSTARGWPPERYRELGTGFVIRELVGVHTRELVFGEDVRATTWIREARRGIVMHRETRIDGVFAGTAEWVHVGPPPGVTYDRAVAEGTIGPVRAPAPLADAFPTEGGAGVALPAWTPTGPEPLPSWSFEPWWTEMDPMGHTNHPRYVDWGDEALSRWLHAQGADPIALVPVAERVRFRAGARAGERLDVEGARVGTCPEGEVFQLRVVRGATLVADLTLVRRLPAKI